MMSIFGVVLPRHTRTAAGLHLTRGDSLLVPVLSPSGSGCRSTVAGLLAATFAPVVRTVVLDAAMSSLSPWTSWATAPTNGLASLRHDANTTPAELFASCSRQRLGEATWQVFTGLEPRWAIQWMSPGEWTQLSRLGGWPFTVVDTGHSALFDLTVGPDPVTSHTYTWLADMPAAPLLTIPNTMRAIEYGHRFVTAAERWGLQCSRLTVAVVDTSRGRASRQALAQATVLAGRVASLFRIPFDPEIDANGLKHPDRVAAATYRAVGRVAKAMLRDPMNLSRLTVGDSVTGTENGTPT